MCPVTLLAAKGRYCGGPELDAPPGGSSVQIICRVVVSWLRTTVSPFLRGQVCLHLLRVDVKKST